MASVATPARCNALAAARFPSEAYSSTRSGRAPSGWRSQCVRPTTRAPAPSAKSSSVVTGLSETIRRAPCPALTVSPKSSSVRPGARARSARFAPPHDAVTASASSTKGRRYIAKGRTGSRPERGSPQRRMRRTGTHPAVSHRTPPAPPPRICFRGANAGRLLAPGRSLAFPISRSVARERACSFERARYSGVAAPALHRLPCPAFAISCARKLDESLAPGKRRRQPRLESRAPLIVVRLLVRRRRVERGERRLQGGELAFK